MAASDKLVALLNKRSWSSLTGVKGWVQRNTKYKVHAFNGMALIVSNQLIALDSQKDKGNQLSFEQTRKRTL
jgi:hypothetical protein